MIHIVFNEADITTLQEVIKIDESLAGDVIKIADDYAVGPLLNIYQAEGKEARKEWWQTVLAGGDYGIAATDEGIDDYKTIAGIVGTLRRNADEIIWLWVAQNKHDVSGYYWVLHYLKEFQGRVFILYLNNLPFINDKGSIFYPQWLWEIPAKEFLKAKKLARPVTLGEFEADPDEWTKLCNENKGVRILEGGKKLAQFDYDYYDAELKKFVTGEFLKAAKILQQTGSKNKIQTGDAYLLWRLKTMAAQQMFDVQGDLKGMKDFELKTKS